jgi:L-threonylcarbamoyladenylate synthase
MAIIGADISEAEKFLNSGDLVAVPTETVYGLAGSAINEEAVTRIFEVKKRPSFDPLIVHFPSLERVLGWITNIPEAAMLLAENFWPGPLTLILPRPESIPLLVTSGMETVGVRVPDHPLTTDLLDSLEFPIAAPSANPFGYVSPTRPEHVSQQLGDQIHYILDGGPCNIGLESTIIGFENSIPTVYRLGGTSIEAVREVVGNVEVKINSSSNPRAPGMLKSHYSPLKRIKLGNIEENLQSANPDRTGILSFSSYFESIDATHQRRLSDINDLNEASRNLFAYLRYFDTLDIDLILAEPVPDEGLGAAINDRLKRASS